MAALFNAEQFNANGIGKKKLVKKVPNILLFLPFLFFSSLKRGFLISCSVFLTKPDLFVLVFARVQETCLQRTTQENRTLKDLSITLSFANLPIRGMSEYLQHQ